MSNGGAMGLGKSPPFALHSDGRTFENSNTHPTQNLLPGSCNVQLEFEGKLAHFT